jgi:hypothetical protein
VRKLFFLILLTISLFSGRYEINEAIFTNNGWAKPLNRELITSTNYDYDSLTYYNYHKLRHGGVDIIANLNENVYSISDGEIVGIYRRNSTNYNLSVVYIKHKTSDGKEFIAIYGHTYANNNLHLGDRVSKGSNIGIIKRYGSPDHLHFGISTNLNYHYGSFGSIVDGIVNPLEFLSNNVSDGISVYDFWIRDPKIPIYTNGNFDAQFKLKNNSNEDKYYEAVALAIHYPDGRHYKDMMIEYDVAILAGESFESGFIGVDGMPPTAGKYLVKINVKENGNWKALASQDIEVISKDETGGVTTRAGAELVGTTDTKGVATSNGTDTISSTGVKIGLPPGIIIN